ncbi:hypothetical protein FA13DRAFT_1742437, partial [Coprinellus micaceus]
MPQTRRTAKRYTVKIEEELESVKRRAESHRQRIKSHQDQIALEEQHLVGATKKAKELEEKKLKEERAQERRQRQEEQEREKKSNYTRTGNVRPNADLPWERMSGKGICGECQSKGIDCYRVIEAADTRLNQPYVTNAMRVRIGEWAYSCCQECWAKEAKCRVISEIVNGDAVAPQSNSGASGSMKRKREAGPKSVAHTRSRVKLEGVLIERPQLPTPGDSSSPTFRVIPGSNTHFPIQLGTPCPPQQPTSESAGLQSLEKTVRKIQTEQRAIRECLENIMGRLGIQGAEVGVRAGGSKRVQEDRGLSYVTET